MANFFFNLSIIFMIACSIMMLEYYFRHDWSTKGPERSMFHFYLISTFLSMGVAYVLSFFVVVPKTEAQLWQEYKTANGCQVISIDDSSFFRSAKVTYRCATGKTIVKRESHAMRSGN